MTIDDLRKYRNADPFRPFYVILDNGRKLLVREPFNIGYSPGGSRVGVADQHDTASIADTIDSLGVQVYAGWGLSVISTEAVPHQDFVALGVILGALASAPLGHGGAL